MNWFTTQASEFTGIVKFTRKQKVRSIQLALFVAFVIFLEYISRTGMVGVLTLSPPSEMVITLIELLQLEMIYIDILITGLSLITAFFAAVMIGLPLGWGLWKVGTLHQILEPYLLSYYSIPIFVFYPLFIVLFGLGVTPIILIAFLMSIIAIIVNTANGFGKVPKVYRDVGRSMNLTKVEMFRHVLFPAATPYIFTGLKLGFIYSFIGVVATEFILSGAGLGYRINYFYTQFEVTKMYAVMLLVIIVALIANFSLIRIENSLYGRRVIGV